MVFVFRIRRYTPLHYAVVGGNEHLVGGLCQRAPQLLSSINRDGDAPLALAVRHGNDAVVRVMLQNGASPDASNFRGQSALHLAAGAANVVAMRLLLDAGAFVGAVDRDGATPLHCVAVARRSSPPSTADDAAAAAVDSAVDANIASCVSLLKERGALLSARDNDGETPLHWAAREANAAALRALLDAGADASACSDAGENARLIALAAEQGALAIDDSLERRLASRAVQLLDDAIARSLSSPPSSSPSIGGSSGGVKKTLFTNNPNGPALYVFV